MCCPVRGYLLPRGALRWGGKARRGPAGASSFQAAAGEAAADQTTHAVKGLQPVWQVRAQGPPGRKQP